MIATAHPLALNSPPSGAILPRIDNVKIPFEWVAVDYLLSIDSVDFDHGLRPESNRRMKRDDYHYSGLVESIRQDGFHDPIFVYGHETVPEELGNGHHRVLAGLDLGYTHVPVTRDRIHQWETSVSVRDYT